MNRSLSDLNLSWYLEKILKDVYLPNSGSPSFVRVTIGYPGCHITYDFSDEEISNIFEIRHKLEEYHEA